MWSTERRERRRVVVSRGGFYRGAVDGPGKGRGRDGGGPRRGLAAGPLGAGTHPRSAPDSRGTPSCARRRVARERRFKYGPRDVPRTRLPRGRARGTRAADSSASLARGECSRPGRADTIERSRSRKRYPRSKRRLFGWPEHGEGEGRVSSSLQVAGSWTQSRLLFIASRSALTFFGQTKRGRSADHFLAELLRATKRPDEIRVGMAESSADPTEKGTSVVKSDRFGEAQASFVFTAHSRPPSPPKRGLGDQISSRLTPLPTEASTASEGGAIQKGAAQRSFGALETKAAGEMVEILFSGNRTVQPKRSQMREVPWRRQAIAPEFRCDFRRGAERNLSPGAAICGSPLRGVGAQEGTGGHSSKPRRAKNPRRSRRFARLAVKAPGTTGPKGAQRGGNGGPPGLPTECCGQSGEGLRGGVAFKTVGSPPEASWSSRLSAPTGCRTRNGESDAQADRE